MKQRTNFGLPFHAPTRRELIGAATAVLGGLAAGSVYARAGTGEEISHTGESIHQEVVFQASRNRVYHALLDSAQFDKVSRLSAAMKSGMSLGSKPTMISGAVGGAFTLFGGHIIGRHIELVPNQRIVQAWRVANWNPGVYSIAKFELADEASNTKLVFDHTGFPDGQGQHLADGWKANYWEPLEEILGSGATSPRNGEM